MKTVQHRRQEPGRKQTRRRPDVNRAGQSTTATHTAALNSWATQSKSSQSNLTKRPHCRGTLKVHSYSPGGANMHLHLIHASLDPLESISQQHLHRFSRFCTFHGRVPILYNGRPFSPKIAPSHRVFWTIQTHNPNSISIGSAVFAQLTAEDPYNLQHWPLPCFSPLCISV